MPIWEFGKSVPCAAINSFAMNTELRNREKCTGKHTVPRSVSINQCYEEGHCDVVDLVAIKSFTDWIKKLLE
jgi:hypothetical protein